VQAETYARFSLPATSRIAAPGRRTCRWRQRFSESIATDSRVFRRDEAADTPAQAFCAIFFSQGESGSARIVEHAKPPVNASREARDCRKIAP
jgi:hypothetical protein